AHRQATAQLAARGLVADATVQAGAQHVKLRFAHRALETSSRRSLNSDGWYTPSASPISVSVIEHRSSRRYQSALLRAMRDTSSPRMMPTCDNATSAVMRAKPLR